ncbi:short chain dehydrogenase reductase [Stipitochalara longipes BDJ]|nr:short chain dehydrogenase reductase [Stipitochalara longipes BDJ]
MPIPKYENRGPIAATLHFDLDSLKGKSVVITGGANGLGRATLKLFAYVTIGDINGTLGSNTAAELGHNCKFIPCDVRDWDAQVQLFQAAVTNSPSKTCDIVIANAGIWGNGDTLANARGDPSKRPTKPDLGVLDVNQTGALYTTHLAMHYCRREAFHGAKGDKCLIIVSSLAGYMNQPGILQYDISKNTGRVVMRVLRQGSWKTGVRVNCIAPWLIPTDMMTAEEKTWLAGSGLDSASVEDAVKTVLKIATDTSMNGRSLAVVPKNMASEGYLDLDLDDHKDGDFVGNLEMDLLAALEKAEARIARGARQAGKDKMKSNL